MVFLLRKGTPTHPITPSSVPLEQASSLTVVDHAILSPGNGSRMAVLGSNVKNWKRVARGDVPELRGGEFPKLLPEKRHFDEALLEEGEITQPFKESRYDYDSLAVVHVSAEAASQPRHSP
jgi:hypothetical protein